MTRSSSPLPSSKFVTHAVFAGILLFTGSAAVAQCVAGWSEGFGSPYLQPSGFSGALGTFDDGSGPRLFAGANAASDHGSLMQWNGVAWSAVPFLPTWQSGTMPPVPLALAAFDDGSGPALYVGFSGAFSTTNGIALANIGRWNGTNWAPVGAGLNGAVRTLCVFDDGAGPALHAGGTFGASGSVVLNSLARWTGTAWVDVGQGAFGDIHALRSWTNGSGPGLYAVGRFTFTGMGIASNVARWNGTAWTALGAGISGPSSVARDAVVYDDGFGPALFVGGFFSVAGGMPANHIAKWNGSAWSTPGSGLGSTGLSALTAWDDGGGSALFAFGQVTSAGGTSTGGVARYRGGAWSPAGSGFGAAQGYSGLVFDDGTGPALHAAMSTPGSTTHSEILRWDGTAWSSLPGNGVAPTGSLSALVSGDLLGAHALFAGGSFLRIGGVAASGVAAFLNGQWLPLGSAALGSVEALAIFDSGNGPELYAGGGVPGTVARWNGSSWGSVLGGLTGGPPLPLPPLPVAHAFTVMNDGSGPKLVVGGIFTSAGGVPANSMAAWNGTAWSDLGAPTGIEVKALAFGDIGTGPRLFGVVRPWGGGITTPNSVFERVGTSWQVIATTGGVSNARSALRIFDDGSGPALFLGGAIGSLNGSSATGVMKWNGTSWSSVGPASPTSVAALTIWDDGSGPALFATSATGVLKMLGPGIWTPLGGTFQNTSSVGGQALVAHDDGSGSALFVGGTFGGVGGVPSRGIAKWGPLRPTISMTQGSPGGPVTVQNTSLVKSHEYYNIFSDTPCGGLPGGGPYLGLCAPDPSLLLFQFSLPVGAVPIHFLSPVGARTFGGILLPPGLSLDAVCFDWTGGTLGCWSRVARISVQ